MDDEEFARRLRAQAEQVAPDLDLDVPAVLRAGRRRRTVRAVTVVAAVASVALGAGVAVAAVPRPRAVAPAGPQATSSAPSAETTTAPAAAAAEAAQAAAAAAQAAAAAAAAVKYWHVTVLRTLPDGTTHTVEDWYGHTDPSEEVVDGDLGSVTFFGPMGWAPDDWDPATQNGWDELLALPTEPAALEARLRLAVTDRDAQLAAQGGDYGWGTQDDKVWAQVVRMLAGTPAPQALRAGLVQVAEALPSTQITAAATDAQGRTGTALTRPTGDGSTATLVVSPGDSRILELRTTSPTGPTVSTYLSAGPADGPPVQPDLAASGCASWASC